MIIDAMDILYSGTVDGFCIASSDSDFTRLVARLRESGMYVLGMGESKTPLPFVSACNEFKYLDLLLNAILKEEKEQAASVKELETAVSEKKKEMCIRDREKKGKVILATVKGDIHDIGKNIVKVLLENYGYQVLDLGRDVAVSYTHLEKDGRRTAV